MRPWIIASIVVSLAGATAARAAQTAELECTASTGLTSVHGKMHQSNGAGPTTPIHQDQNWQGFQNKTLLMAFNTKAIQGWKIDKAFLHIYIEKGDLYGVGLCEVLAPWNEGSGMNFEEAPGAACWSFARLPKDPSHPAAGDLWAWPGSGIYSVSWAHPAARYSHAGPGQIERDKVGSTQPVASGPTTQEDVPRLLHLRIPVDADMVAALAAGTSYGMILTDDKGQVAEAESIFGPGTPSLSNDAEDTYVFTRRIQDPHLRPRLEVIGEPAAPGSAPSAPTILKASISADPSASVALDLSAPADSDGAAVLAYEAYYRAAGAVDSVPMEMLPAWMMPRPLEPGANQRLVLWNIPPGKWQVEIRSVDREGRRSQFAVATAAVPEPMKLTLNIASAQAKEPPVVAPSTEPAQSVYVVPDMVRVDPVSGAILRDGDSYRQIAGYAAHNSVWDAGNHQISLSALRNEVVAFNVVVQKGEKGAHDVKLELGDLKGAGGATIAARNLSAYRLWYVKSPPAPRAELGPGQLEDQTLRPVAWHADACLPLSAPFATSASVPAADNGIDGQTNATIGVDLYVPRDSQPGKYDGTIKMTCADWVAPVELKVALNVIDAALPDDNTFKIELNCYGGLARFVGLAADDPKATAAEWMFYQLAKKHRLMINALPYAQRGAVDASRSPVVGGDGADTHVTDWSAWDTHYGPLLDGAAFDPAKGYIGPGAMRPISHVYLPLNENWPMPLEKYYGDYAKLTTRAQFAQWAKTSRPLDVAFNDAFKRGYENVAKDFADHFASKGWTATRFQVFFNDKYFYKVSYYSAAGGSTGSSFWLLDESVDYDDYAANRFFLSLARKGIMEAKHPEVNFDYRVDVSQPEMTRGLFDHVVNLWMNGLGALDSQYVTTGKIRQKFLPNEKFWFYGGGPSLSAAPVNTLQLLLSEWAEGADGALPYWTTLEGKDWTKSNDLAMYYTGKNYANSGKNFDGPLAGLRLKILRRCQQDIELLQMVATKKGWSRAQARSAVSALADDPKATVLTFTKLSADQQDAIRDFARSELAATAGAAN